MIWELQAHMNMASVALTMILMKEVAEYTAANLHMAAQLMEVHMEVHVVVEQLGQLTMQMVAAKHEEVEQSSR